MSKIEKALTRAREERGNLPLVPVPGSAHHVAGTALLAERAARPETIARMAHAEHGLLSPLDLSSYGIISKANIDDPAVQIFRELRTKIVQQSKGGNCIVLVAGVSKGSGASFVARNLSAAFAFDHGKTALLIDCNLRNPSVQKLVGGDPAEGLTDYLENPDIDVGRIIHPVGIARMRAIPAGQRASSDTEHFTSLKMHHLVASLRQRYAERYVVLDAPPMTDSSDIRILAELSDYVLLVARYGRSTTAQIDKCAAAFDPGKLLGVVFNDEPCFPAGHARKLSEGPVKKQIRRGSGG